MCLTLIERYCMFHLILKFILLVVLILLSPLDKFGFWELHLRYLLSLVKCRINHWYRKKGYFKRKKVSSDLLKRYKAFSRKPDSLGVKQPNLFLKHLTFSTSYLNFSITFLKNYFGRCAGTQKSSEFHFKNFE